jgi:hypothetical protein
MAYDSTKMRMAASFGIDSGNMWVYNSPDPHATTEGAAYFSNGGKIGMKVADIVIVVEPAGGTTVHSVTVVAAPPNAPTDLTPGAATISAGQFA